MDCPDGLKLWTTIVDHHDYGPNSLIPFLTQSIHDWHPVIGLVYGPPFCTQSMDHSYKPIS